MASGKPISVSIPVAETWRFEWKQLLPFAPLIAVLPWAYAEPLRNLSERWATEPDYNHGFLVPLFSLYLLWSRRRMLDVTNLRGSWWGLAFLLLAAGMRLFSALLFYPSMDAQSLIPCLAGVVLLIGGWNGLRWAWPSILFLLFMMPLPGVMATLFSHRLQRLTTICSTWLLQLLGLPAISQGNVIKLTQGEIGVVEACSGLRMLMLFLAITVAASFLMNRPAWEKFFIAGSAMAIGIVANLVRITATALLFEYFDPNWAHFVFHDMAGWLMMPLAMVLLAGELWLLSLLLIAPDETRPLVIRGSSTKKPSSAKQANGMI